MRILHGPGNGKTLRAFGRVIDLHAHHKKRQWIYWKQKAYHARLAGAHGSCWSAECRQSHRHRAVRAHVDALVAVDAEAATWLANFTRGCRGPSTPPSQRPAARRAFARLMGRT